MTQLIKKSCAQCPEVFCRSGYPCRRLEPGVAFSDNPSAGAILAGKERAKEGNPFALASARQ